MGSRCWPEYGQVEKETMFLLYEAILAAPAGWGSSTGVQQAGVPEETPGRDAGGVAGKEPGLLEGAPAPAALGGGQGGEGGGPADCREGTPWTPAGG